MFRLQFSEYSTPIIDTTTTPHYNVGKFLASLLNPLTLNQFNLNDTFDAVSAIKAIPSGLFDEGYRFVSFDVVSLFTNVPLKRTIDLVLKRVFDEKLINTTLSKRTLKKLISDSCSKTAFSFDNKIYEQIDGVSMGSCLAPVLANIILTEFEKQLVEDLIEAGTIKFYRRYVDDTLVLIKPCDIPLVLKKFNSFDKNLNFTVDKFEDGKVHFLDLEISESGIDVFRKTTHTGQYTNFHSFKPWSRKTAWIKSLFCRAVRICSNTFFLNRQISTISKFMAWNGFPASFRCAILRKLKSKHNSNNPAPYSNTSSENNLSNNTADENISKIWVRIPFLGKQGEYLVKTLIRKLQRNLTKPVKFIVIYQTKKVSYFLSKKDKIPDLERNDLVYEFSCPGCSVTYIGKTVRNLRTRLTEHAKLNTSAVSEHLKTCEHATQVEDLGKIL